MNQPTDTRASLTRACFATLLLTGFISLAASVNAAEYYTWVDENGVTNFSQRGPENADARAVSKTRESEKQAEIDSARPKPIPEPVSTEIDPDAVIAEERAAVAAKIAEQKAANCEIGKRNLTSLQMYERIRVMGEDGKERLLSDEEKAERMATARETIREYCTS